MGRSSSCSSVLRKSGALLSDALDDPLALHDLDVREGDRGADGMAAEGDPVREARFAFEERLHHDGRRRSRRRVAAYAEEIPFAQVIRSG